VFIALFDLVGVLLSHPADLGGCIGTKTLLKSLADGLRIRGIARDLLFAGSQEKQR
jgi:hypothetical protein